MMDSTKTVPAFYEPVVPQIVPQLLSQTNILLHAHQIPSLVAHEELNTDSRSSGVVRSHRSTPSRSQGPYAKSVAFREASRTPRSPTPPITIRSTIRKHAMPESRGVTPQPEEDEESDSDVSHTSSVHSQLSDDFKIPKPIGEVGRPGSGGYSLNAELGLHPKSFKELKEYVNKLIGLHLDVTTCYSRQDKQQIRRVVKTANLKFPDLERYSGGWPVKDLIKARLKYMTRVAKQVLDEEEEEGSRSRGSSVTVTVKGPTTTTSAAKPSKKGKEKA